MRTTAHVHAEADAAASSGDFRVALALVTEILRRVPTDHRARLKAGLCLGALGRQREGASAVLLVARGLGQQGFVLAAIGACRDALHLDPTHPGVRPVLEQLYELFGGVEGRPIPRVPPPIVPMAIDDDDFHPRPDAPDLIERSRAIAMADPIPGSSAFSGTPAPVPFFSDLGRAAFVELVQRMKFRKLTARTFVVTQGDPGDSLFVVASGEVEVTFRDDSARVQKVATLTAGNLFGEMSLLTERARTASVETMKPTELFEIDRSALEAVARRHPEVLTDIVRFARVRMSLNLMGTSPMFRTLSEAERREVCAAFETRVVKPGEVVIEVAQPPPGLYLVLEGELEVSLTDASGDQVVLGYVRAGEVVGEISLIDNSETTARVRASERSVMLHLSKTKFDQFVEAYPDLRTYLKEMSAERLVEAEVAAADGYVVDADELVLI